MPEFIVTCDVPFVIDNQGDLSCSGIASQYERSQTISDLSQFEIGELSAVVLFLFSVAFGFRLVRKMFLSPGRM